MKKVKDLSFTQLSGHGKHSLDCTCVDCELRQIDFIPADVLKDALLVGVIDCNYEE